MGEADVTLNQPDEKPPDSGLVPGEDSVVWSHEVEVCLFHAMIGHKPVGVNRHFHMICIRDKFSQNIGRQVSSSVIWDHLGTMYDMQALRCSTSLRSCRFQTPRRASLCLMTSSRKLKKGSCAWRRRPRRSSGWRENLQLHTKKNLPSQESNLHAERHETASSRAAHRPDDDDDDDEEEEEEELGVSSFFSLLFTRSFPAVRIKPM
uniref:MRG domain binding protein n=1 Tax=Gasterosteus aculeatus aculeatus TaxID=481459 RepID=A0AAQ4PXN0_GASAC